MRRALALLILFLLASMPASASEGRGGEHHTEYALPPVQWNASVDIGYISTAPLVAAGLVIVKGGGDPMTGEGAGLAAFRADTGEEVWRALHEESTAGFEVAPLLHSPAVDYGGCLSNVSQVITGWSTGSLTAHYLSNGTEAWNISTPAPQWGISGGGFLNNESVVWPTETGVVRICQVNGTQLGAYHDPDLRTYRAGIGFEPYEGEYHLGTEDGTLLFFDLELNLTAEYDLAAELNRSGSWRIRSVAQAISSAWILAHLHGDGESVNALFDWNGTEISLNRSFILPEGTSTKSAGMAWQYFVGTNGGVSHLNEENGSLVMTPYHDAKNVVGELNWVTSNEVLALCIPQNDAHGSWLMAFDENHSEEWVPDVGGYLTAGCGSDYTVIAAANDASWLEVRYDENNTYDIHRQVEATLGIEVEIDSEDIPERVEERDELAESEPEPVDNYAVVWVPIWGAVLVFLIGCIAPKKDVQRQIFAGAALMLLLGLVLVASVYSQAVVDDPVPDSSGRTQASDLHNWQAEEGVVHVAFHFPEDVAPMYCQNEMHWIRGSPNGGTLIANWQISETPGSHCVWLMSIPVEGATTAEEVTVEALNVYWRTAYQIEMQTMGPFLADVEDAVGGSENRWWTYDLNGGYGTLGMFEQVVVPGDEIDWHFDAGQF
jgi:hypothetical protein